MTLIMLVKIFNCLKMIFTILFEYKIVMNFLKIYFIIHFEYKIFMIEKLSFTILSGYKILII
jgi:hypothetical protein